MVPSVIRIPHNRPLITAEDRTAVDAVLRSGWLAAGPEVAGLEADFAAYFGGGRACALSSGTAALFVALHSLGVGAGGRVAVPTYACSALVNAVLMAGATVVPVDVRRGDYTLDPDALHRVQAATPLSAIIAIHTYGAAADMMAIGAVGPTVIEDCCQSIGSAVAGRPLGTKGAAAIFSFYATKVITSGHGGLLFDGAETIAAAAHDYRAFDGRDIYAPRFNYHLSDIQAAMARQQFRRLAEIRERRHRIASLYFHALPHGIQVQSGMSDGQTMIYRFVIEAASSEQRDNWRRDLLAQGIETIIPVERFELLHRYLGLDPSDFPNAEDIVDRTLSLPIHPSLSDSEVAYVSESLSNITQH